METKICSKCGIEKELTEFNAQKQGKYGKRSYCRECQRQMAKEYKSTDHAKELRRAWKRTPVARECEKRYRERNKGRVNFNHKIKAKIILVDGRTFREEKADKERFSGNRVKTLERDGYKCTECGSTTNLQVHHKDESGRNKPKELRNDRLDNLVTLCGKCHIKRHNPVLKRWQKVGDAK
jgi:5-methylcytosine-specific restriction endonuclease McrA